MFIDYQLEEGTDIYLDFEKLRKVAQTDHPVIPVAVQDVDSKAVLLIGYVNERALDYALEHRVATSGVLRAMNSGLKGLRLAICSNWSMCASTASKIHCFISCASKAVDRVIRKKMDERVTAVITAVSMMEN